VQADKLRRWHEYWGRKPKTRELRDANRDGSLSQTVMVTARNKAEAAKKAIAIKPGYVAIKESIERHR
jgi:hypothetical protein